jgi:hypothetical protein
MNNRESRRREQRDRDDRQRDSRDVDDYEFSDALRAGRQVQSQSMRRPEAIRPESINIGVQFWNDQRMADKTVRDKETFLRDKGLSHEEIREVRARAEEEMLMRQPPSTPLNSPPTGLGRATIQGQPVQYIPIPIPSNPAGSLAPPPTLVSRVMSAFQTLAVGAGVLVAGNYAYQQYMLSQRQGGNNPLLTWGGNQNHQPQPQYGQQPQSSQQTMHPGGGNGNISDNHTNTSFNEGRVPNPLTLGGGQNLLTPSGPRRSNDAEDTLAVREMKQGLRDMQERMELQSSQLREAVKQLHEIATTQSREASNHTSMGLLLANTRAEQSAQERSIRDELAAIKDMIRDRVVVSENNRQQSVPSTKQAAVLSANSTAAAANSTATNSTAASAVDGGLSNADDSAPTLQKTEEEKDAERERKLQDDLSQRTNAINTAVQAVKGQNEPGKLKVAFNMLEMLLKNLVENPDVPRYRKIVMTNRNFKKCLGDVEGHEELLTACGFVKNGKNFEWSLLPKSHEVQDEDMVWARKLHDAVLTHARDTIKQLSTTQSAATKVEERKIPNNSSNDHLSTTTLPEAAAIATEVLDARTTSSMHTLQQPTLITPAASPSTTSNVSNQVLSKVSNAGKSTVQPSQLESNKTSSESESDGKTPEYPLAFQEVMKLVQDGKDPPGIRKIPEQLSSDAQKFLGSTSLTADSAAISRETASAPDGSLAPIPKPWEAVSSAPAVQPVQPVQLVQQPDNILDELEHKVQEDTVIEA